MRAGSEGMREAVRDGGILLLPPKMQGFGAEQETRSVSAHARARTHNHIHTRI